MTQDNTPKITLDIPQLAELLREAATPKPLTPQQIRDQNARALAEGEESRRRDAEARRELLGLPRPRPGDKLVVRCARTNGRRRAGIDFSTHPTTLEVTDLSTEEAKKLRPENGGDGPISVDESVTILADDALAVSVLEGRGYRAPVELPPTPEPQADPRAVDFQAWEDDLAAREAALNARAAELEKAKSAPALPLEPKPTEPADKPKADEKATKDEKGKPKG